MCVAHSSWLISKVEFSVFELFSAAFVVVFVFRLSVTVAGGAGRVWASHYFNYFSILVVVVVVVNVCCFRWTDFM